MKMLFDTLDASDLQVIRWPALDVRVLRAVIHLPHPSVDHWLFHHHTSPPVLLHGSSDRSLVSPLVFLGDN